MEYNMGMNEHTPNDNQTGQTDKQSTAISIGPSGGHNAPYLSRFYKDDVDRFTNVNHWRHADDNHVRNNEEQMEIREGRVILLTQ